MSSNNQQVIPMLAYEDGVEAMNWLCKTFGFLEKTKMLDDNGRLAHGEIAMGKSIIMVASPSPDYQSPAHHSEMCESMARWREVPYIFNGVLVYVDDVKKHFQTAKDNGAVILSDVEEGGPGSRYRVEDLEGHRWMFMERG
ncbi:VOC family protein [Chryseolinea sp. T2]|uniref:VOC family protein n=1 Tax=Chryseolinea sp. T2 TaxID=3129255 RepID=UPI0030786F3A